MTMRSVVTAFLLATKIASISSFVVITNHSHGHNPQQPLKSTVDDDIHEAQFTDPSSLSPQTHEKQQQQFELWLDLRQTTISPQAALLHLTNDLWDEYVPPENKSFLIDKVLVNAKSSLEGNDYDEQDKIRMRKVVDDVKDEYEEEIQVLFQDNNGVIKSISMAHSQNSRKSVDDDVNVNTNVNIQTHGRKYQIYDDKTGSINIYANPMPALETISSGNWLVLDSSLDDKEKRKEAVQSLVELCSGSLSLNLDLNLSGGENEEKRRDESRHSNNSESVQGGIAIDCSSGADIFEAGALIKSLSGNEKGYEATESGILVQSDRVNDSGMLSPKRENNGSIKYAILIPFDALLWKTASFVISSDGVQST
eukprot:CAMPEP_0203675310 /NCGR_PEP_ID=MMETSP0090-20130426/19780_1 /ASSEMBLY_ACC=CAM_ASM_001088 /TAXON_ID=426623 /ORGANISM="Chaetoceros affinis, Strain CCMP159" /LENGTH=366 /DNA_ID=CAMNT_0050541463 /DNA_START=40 /DNA_END=1137 /DNA_ORIENTATION=+